MGSCIEPQLKRFDRRYRNILSLLEVYANVKLLGLPV